MRWWVVALMVLGVAQGCDLVGQNCECAGATWGPNAYIYLDGQNAPPGTYTFTITAAGETSSCELGLVCADPNAEPCVSPQWTGDQCQFGTRSGTPGAGSPDVLLYYSHLPNSPPDSLEITVARDGEVVLNEELSPDWQHMSDCCKDYTLAHITLQIA